MAEDAGRFSEILREEITGIVKREKLLRSAVYLQLGLAIGKTSGASIDSWSRKQTTPSKKNDVENLALEIKKRGGLQGNRFEEFLVAGGYTNPPPLDKLPQDPFFTGREEELQELLKYLHPGRMVALYGTGGIGKTALAAEVLHRLAPNDRSSERFPDGIFYHNFYRERSADSALERIARVFGNDEPLHPPQPEREAAYTPFVAAYGSLVGKQALLVLDGAEEADSLDKVLDVRRNCGVFIISRYQPAPRMDKKVTLDVLSDEQASKVLFAWSTDQQDQPGFDVWGHDYELDQKLAGEICKLLGCLPLALRLAGRYMASYFTKAPLFLELLKNSPLLVLEEEDRQHHSVPVLLEAMIGKIDPKDQLTRQVLAVVGVLAYESFSAEVMSAALKTPEHQIVQSLNQLIKLSLLNFVEGRYQVVHRLVHTYVADPENGLIVPDGVVESLTIHYTALARTQTQLGIKGFVPLDLERPHLMAILAKCESQQEWTRIKDLVWAIDEYLNLQGHWSQREMTLQTGLTAVRALASTQDEGGFLNKLAAIYRQQGRWDKAIQICQESLQVFQESQNRSGEAQVLNMLGAIYFDQSQWREAIRYFEESLHIFQELEDHRGQAQIHNNLSECYRRLGSLDIAIQQVEKALDIFRETGDQVGESKVLTNLGNLHADQGHSSEAIKMYQASLFLKKTLGDLPGEAVALNNLAMVFQDQGQLYEASNYYQQALTTYRKIGARPRERMTLNELAGLYADQGDLTQAIETYQDSLRIAQDLYDRSGEAYTLNNLGIVYADLGRFNEALKLYERSLQIKQELGDRLGAGDTLTNLGRVKAEQGDIDEAIKLIEESLQIAQESDNRQGEALALEDRALVYAKQNDWAKAVEKYEEALALFRELGLPLSVGRTLVALSTAYIFFNRFVEAEAAIEEALALFRELGARHHEGIALMRLGFYHEKQGQQEQAFELWEQALPLVHPESPDHKLLTQQFQQAE